VTELFAELPKHKQTIAGKSIPLEKFVLRKARKYAIQGNTLFLPHLEISYIWQGLKFTENREKSLEEIDAALRDVEKKMEGSGKKKGKSGEKEERVFLIDDFTMAHLFKVFLPQSNPYFSNQFMLDLKGVLLKQLGHYDASHQSFQKIFKVESEIELDHYVAPFAHFEYV
jgi:hypothetical protein